jgi:hypothetical protein
VRWILPVGDGLQSPAQEDFGPLDLLFVSKPGLMASIGFDAEKLVLTIEQE